MLAYAVVMVVSAGVGALVVFLLMREAAGVAEAEASLSARRIEDLQSKLQRTATKLVELRAKVQEARTETLSTDEIVERLKEIKL